MTTPSPSMHGANDGLTAMHVDMLHSDGLLPLPTVAVEGADLEGKKLQQLLRQAQPHLSQAGELRCRSTSQKAHGMLVKDYRLHCKQRLSSISWRKGGHSAK